MNLIEIADPLTFTLEQRAEVRKVAKALKGITLNKGFGALWNELIHRLKTPVFDAYGKLRDMYAKEGGNVDDFDTVFELAQGIPVYNRIKRDPISRTFRTIWDVTGAMQTSLSVAPNMPQVMALVARYTGLFRFAEAVRTSILDPEVTESQLTAMGAFPRAMMSWGSERGYGLETFGRWFKQAVAKGTGAQAIAQWNYTVSGEAFRMLAQSWQAHGIKKGDLTVAQQLSLERGEIEAINSGKMDPATFRKIVQRGVALTQYMTEATFRKSKLENVPLARMLFSYMNYTMGATRAAVTMGKDFATAFKSRDPVLLWGMARRLTAMVAGSVGAGMLSVMLRRALRQDPPPPPEDEEGMQKYVDAMIEVQLFGAAQRATQPTNYDNGITEKYFVGLMPQVSMLTDLFGAVIGGYGRFADFPRGERVSQSLLKNTAVVKAGLKLFQDLAYPDEPQYERTRREVGDWMEKKLGIEKRIQQAEIKPDYYHVFQMIERGDEEGAGEQAQRYYRKVIGQKGDIVKAVRGLRSSLMSRSPIALAGPNLVQFLMTLSPRDRVKAFRTHLTYLQRLNQVAPRI
jgi:hypothetical protein